MKRRRLAATRRAGHEKDAIGTVHDPIERCQLGLVEADLLEIEELLGIRQQAKDEAFAMGHRHGREPHVVVAARDLEPDTAVLGQRFSAMSRLPMILMREAIAA